MNDFCETTRSTTWFHGSTAPLQRLNAPVPFFFLFSSGNNGHGRQSGARVQGRRRAPTRLTPPRDGFHAPWRRAIGTSKPDRWRRDRAVATRDARLRATKRDGPPGMRPRVAVRRDARGVRRVRVAAKHAGVPRVRREVSSRHTLLRHLRPARGARRARPQLRAGRCASANGTRSTPTLTFFLILRARETERERTRRH